MWWLHSTFLVSLSPVISMSSPILCIAFVLRKRIVDKHSNRRDKFPIDLAKEQMFRKENIQVYQSREEADRTCDRWGTCYKRGSEKRKNHPVVKHIVLYLSAGLLLLLFLRWRNKKKIVKKIVSRRSLFREKKVRVWCYRSFV